MKRVIIATAGLFALVAFVVPSHAAAAKASATITFDVVSQSGDLYYYGGTISSTKQKCESSRKITVYKEEPGDDEKIGSDKSFANFITPEDDYVWQVEVFGQPDSGTYLAKSTATKKCKKAESNPYIYPAP